MQSVNYFIVIPNMIGELYNSKYPIPVYAAIVYILPECEHCPTVIRCPCNCILH